MISIPCNQACYAPDVCYQEPAFSAAYVPLPIFGYGLTLGIHTRVDATRRHILEPGRKQGGRATATERSLSMNTTASGGNAALMSLAEDD